LDPYKVEIDQLCSANSSTWEEFKGQEIWLAAMVAAKVQKRTKTDKIFLNIQLEDLQGSMELTLFGSDVANYGSWFEPGNALLIRFKVAQRYNSQEQWELKPIKVLLLQDARSELFKGLRVDVDIAKLASMPRQALHDCLKKHAGKCSVYLHLHDTLKGFSLQTIARQHRVDLSNDLMKELAELGFEKTRLVK
jgi:DNA polymerase-3 subunit alpha